MADRQNMQLGMENALNRCVRRFGEGPMAAMREEARMEGRDFPRLETREGRHILTEVERALEQEEGESHPEFVTLFTELAVTGAIARRINDEPPLTRDDISLGLTSARLFLNHFWRR